MQSTHINSVIQMNKTDERVQIPAVSGIIERNNNGTKEILIQKRQKDDTDNENGLFEIPAGKIREFESIYSALRREVLEETGLQVTKIFNEIPTQVCTHPDYKVIGCEPFFVSQNIFGDYPILCITLLCEAQGKLLLQSNESISIQWVDLNELNEMVFNNPASLYPMHTEALRKYLRINKNENK